MKTQSAKFQCKRCSHEWLGTLPVDVPVTAFIAFTNKIICPKCTSGRRNILLVKTPVESEAGK